MDSRLSSGRAATAPAGISRLDFPRPVVEKLPSAAGLPASQTSSDSVVLNLEEKPQQELLALTAQKVIEKLEGLLGSQLPYSEQKLDSSVLTPEKVADEIVEYVSGFVGSRLSRSALPTGDLLREATETAERALIGGFTEAREMLKGIGADGDGQVRRFLDETAFTAEQRVASLKKEIAEIFALSSAPPAESPAGVRSPT